MSPGRIGRGVEEGAELWVRRRCAASNGGLNAMAARGDAHPTGRQSDAPDPETRASPSFSHGFSRYETCRTGTYEHKSWT